ncbi:arylsulfotransferase family protein [Halocatena halophila]|uniref:arylsulfotransferase family protein n=1 Tax=Halocatena halophila TaxID=2814576 RepID=UPI002ED67AD9
MFSQRTWRIVFTTGIVLVCGFLIVTNAGASSFVGLTKSQEPTAQTLAPGESVAPPADGPTVVSSHDDGELLIVGKNGTVTYHNTTYDGYWDVDPVDNDSEELVYTATERFDDDSCSPTGSHCIKQRIERLNRTTGKTTVLYSHVQPRYEASEWHDTDRINDTHYLVADMYADSVFMVNVETDLVVWEWSAQASYPIDEGGKYPDDWVHLNDVERLNDGRIMVSLRNQDQVVFIDPSSGRQSNWTLGGEDDHDVLYEQHNPDFISSERGGPAVVVADSEQNRLVEYQRTDSSGWTQSWIWTDSTLQWPRDADRLPNGNTLVTDTRGGRVLEVTPNGSIGWEFAVQGGYEAERLSTGDESTGGPSAKSAGLTSRTDTTVPESAGPVVRVRTTIEQLLPNKVVNGIANFGPGWLRFDDLLVGLVGGLLLACWLAAEWHWSSLSFQSPIRRD